MLIVGCALVLTACAAAPVAEIAPGRKPASESDEAGLWMIMDKTERELVTSGALADDARLQEYVGEIACRLTPEYCRDIRVYVVERPDFNATMAPNGFMTVWTGLILRCENEAQLAAVIGHEIAHYRYRHSLLMWRSIRATSDALLLANMAFGAAGAGQLAGLGTEVVAYGRIMSFSREHEREADALGFELMATAGYDPLQASMIWEGLIAEKEAAGADAPPVLFATHPSSPERAATLRAMARGLEGSEGGARGQDAFLEVTLDHRAEWLRAELTRRRFDRVQVLLDRLIAQGVGLGTLYFQQGELHRLRGEDGDRDLAIEAYQEAVRHADAPAGAYREMGFVYWSRGRHAAARHALELYLELSPEATDRAMIESYLEELQ